MVKIGERVGCILSSNAEGVKFLGFGKYVGDFVPHEKVGGIGRELNELDIENPKIILDNGKDVFGCECWWGEEDEIKKQLEGRNIIEIDIDEHRKSQLPQD
jgi:hypothetical protein